MGVRELIMSNFIKQIQQDIVDYQKTLEYISNIKKDEWAFNYWVLDKLFYEDEELIEEKILDYHDLGIDAFEFYEETKDLYLIQNKYYSDNTGITAEYIKNDFLLRPINALKNGTYKKSKDLQDIFTKYKNHEGFVVYLQLFVTNNKRNIEADSYIKKFNLKNPGYRAEIYYLDDIENKYYGDIKQVRSNLSAQIESVNKGTILNINTDDYKLANVLDAKYVFTPVTSVYRLYRNSLEKNYPIFDMNIREYLGNTGVNKNIYNTLLDKEDRKNFFYYNNGITLICEEMTKIEIRRSNNNMNAHFNVKNPQIVNGCQTVNSIYEVLKNVDPNNLEKEYKDAFVMLKILQIDRKNEAEEKLYKNIVKYNNSQNSIDEKTFVANTSLFLRLQLEFEDKGFLLLIKQSDKNTYKNKYSTVTKLRELSSERFKRYGLGIVEKVADCYIPLEKFMQVILAFKCGGYYAFTKKSNLLKFGSEQYNDAIEFIKDNDATIDVLIDLFLLYKKAELLKNSIKDNRIPIPYYLVDAFAKYECNERCINKICEQLNSNEKIEKLMKLYTAVSKAYTKNYNQVYGFDYTQMIKKAIDYNILGNQRDNLIDVL